MTAHHNSDTVHDKNLAHAMAFEHDKHWKVAARAKELDLGRVATDVLLAGEQAAHELQNGSLPEKGGQLNIRARTFEEANEIQRKLSDRLVEEILGDSLTVGGEKVYSVKGFLDSVPLDSSDIDVLKHPEKIVTLYRTEMSVVHDLLTAGATHAGHTEDRWQIDSHVREIGEITADLMRNWMAGSGKTKGISTGLRWGLPDQTNLWKYGDKRPNLSVQDHGFAVGIMAYSKKRVAEKVNGTGEAMTKRIYLNPKIMDAPGIFGSLLHKFDTADLSTQMKMWGREGDLLRRVKQQDTGGSLRGDGIVVYVNDAEANDALRIVLEVATQNARSFSGRALSRTPQKIADGIGVGDEPRSGKSSLTSHRAAFLEFVKDKTKQSGRSGQAEIDYFQKAYVAVAEINGIDPRNLAFNA